MALNAAQLTLLRDRHPHLTSMYLSILAPDMSAPSYPDVVYSGTVNGAHDRGARAITVANIGVGNIANVVAGQTVLVGTSTGDNSISKRRLRSRNGQVLTLDANGVPWVAGDTLTVVENWEFWPVYPRILNVSPYTMYKDYDVVYSDENEEPPPVANMGPPYAGWLEDSDAVTLVGTDSYAVAVGATISTYLWQTTGGAIANANVGSTTIDFSGVGAGLYWVYLTVTDSNGKTQITYRPFFVHDTSTFPPFFDFNANVSLTTSSGNDMRVTALSDVDFDDVPDQAMVVLWGDEYFRDASNPVAWTKQSIGGYTGRENIKFVGYLDKDSITSDPDDIGALTFDVLSLPKIMSDTMMWSVALNDQLAVPTTWYQYLNLTTMRAIHHLWRYHSTLFSVTDVMLPTGNTLRRFAMDFSEGDLIGQARLASWHQGIYANIGSTKQGIIHVEIDPQMIPEGDRGGIDVVQTLTDEDWFDDIEIIRDERIRTAWVNFSGMAWDGATKSPFVSTMPGEADGAAWDSTPEVSGESREEGNKLLEDQTDSNEKAGLVYARLNNDLKEIRTPKLAGNYTHVDTYPQSYYTVDIPPNKRGLDTADTRDSIPRRVNLNYNAAVGNVDVSVVFEPETEDVIDGVPGNYPTTTPTPTPAPSPPEYPNPELVGNGMALFGLGDGVWWGSGAGTTWAQRNGTRAGADLNDRSGYADPWGPNPAKKGSYDPEKAILWSFGVGYIYRSDDAGRYWMNVTPTDDPPNAWNDAPAPVATDLTYEMGVADWHVNQRHYVIAWYQNAGSEYRGYLLVTSNDGRSWTWYAMGSDNPTVATWTFGDVAIINENMWCDSTDSGNPTRTLSNPQNLLADDGASGGPSVSFVARADNTALWQTALIVDFGGWFRLDGGTVDGGVNVEAEITTSTDTMTITDATVVDILVEFTILHRTQCDSNRTGGVNWDGAVDGYPVAALPSTKNDNNSFSDYVRYATIAVGAPSGARYRGTGTWQHLFDYVKVYPSHVNNECRPISIDVDKENGRFLYISTWEGEGIRVRTYDMDNSLTYPIAVQWLGEATRAEYEARDFWVGTKSLYDVAQANYGDWYVMFGVWESGPGNPEHTWATIIDSARWIDSQVLTSDATWTASEWVGAVKWLTKDRLVVILNRGAADPEVWETTDFGVNWTLLSTVPFTSGFPNGVEFAMTMHGGDDLTIAAGDFAGEEVFSQDSPWTGAWTDITPGGAASTRMGSVIFIYNEVP